MSLMADGYQGVFCYPKKVLDFKYILYINSSSHDERLIIINIIIWKYENMNYKAKLLLIPKW